MPPKTGKALDILEDSELCEASPRGLAAAQVWELAESRAPRNEKAASRFAICGAGGVCRTAPLSRFRRSGLRGFRALVEKASSFVCRHF